MKSRPTRAVCGDLRSNRPLLPELPDTPAAVGSVSSHQGGKVVELASSSKAPPTGTAESRNSNTARLYQHLYREVAQRFGVLTDAETLAHDDSETLFPMAREEAGQNAESTQEAKKRHRWSGLAYATGSAAFISASAAFAQG